MVYQHVASKALHCALYIVHAFALQVFVLMFHLGFDMIIPYCFEVYHACIETLHVEH